MPVKDSFIAATALAHGLTMATRNRRDFVAAKVPVLDPGARSAPTVNPRSGPGRTRRRRTGSFVLVRGDNARC